MSKSLVIVESPAKDKTISKYLGSDFRVESSVGHIRDLPRSSQKCPKFGKNCHAICSRLYTKRPLFYDGIFTLGLGGQ